MKILWQPCTLTRRMRWCLAFVIGISSPICFAQAPDAGCVAPPIHELLVQADKNGTVSADAVADYEYIYVRSGTISTASQEKEPSEVYLGYSVKGVNITRQYLENGTTLSANRQKKVDGSIEKAIARGVKKQLAAKKPDPNDTYTMLEKTGSLEHLRCRSVAGRRTFFFDYFGNERATTSGMTQKFSKRLNGTVQFDAEDHAATDATFRLGADMRLFLVFKVKKGMTFTLRSVRVAPGLWMLKTNEFSGGGRIYFNGVSATYREDYMDYRRVPRRDTDPYHGVPFGQLAPAIRGAMLDGLEAATHEPLVDLDEQ